MKKSVKARASELVNAFVNLEQAAERWVATTKDRDCGRVRAAQELSECAVEWQQTVARTMKGGPE